MTGEVRPADELRDSYDVVVIGGGAAGLNAALMLARARRSVVVVDAGAPRNAPADGVHGLLARDGMPPAELLERGRAEVRRYGGHVVPGEVATVTHADEAVNGGDDAVSGDGGAVTRAGGAVDGDQGAVSPGTDAGEGFEVALADGRTARARRLLVATGLVDELPDVPGLRERWARDVLHCPYCHGWEVRDQAIGVLASGPMAVHQALLFRQWSDDVTLLTHTMPPPSAEEAEQLAARGIAVVEGEVAAVETVRDRLAGVRLADGTLVRCEALTVSPRMVARVGFLAKLGLHAEEHPLGVGEYVPADAAGRTGVPGVWIAGNVTDLPAQVGAAAAAGATAAGQINADLVTEDTRRAVTALRNSAPPRASAPAGRAAAG
ncbi:NAD(P)/FAD-dependent oxidoreductase [Streptomyces iconiensis]|uniref:NAD(P)/FAD-dependent oxidoreductase n=1 Tax=Streptomyces iconiensis TaxID=1384038 RepID=A0ABT6ZT00_9ACTN|nr:NAD(P)/FAD-dependent oxidoreductase [Streptomyces iconiensis]MDJ1132198.1 NAD(P)/FAD-dependent oxidoreductase [Streptomyces iconiensis]